MGRGKREGAKESSGRLCFPSRAVRRLSHTAVFGSAFVIDSSRAPLGRRAVQRASAASVLGRAAFNHSTEDAIEKRNLGKAARERDVDDRMVCLHQITTGRIQPDLLQKLVQAFAGMFFELP